MLVEPVVVDVLEEDNIPELSDALESDEADVLVGCNEAED